MTTIRNEHDKTQLAARALNGLAASWEADAERPDSAGLRSVYLADAAACRAAASTWETAGEKTALTMIRGWDTLPREDAMIALVRGGALTADEARLTETGRKLAGEPR